MNEPFKELANHLRELADELDLDMVQPTIVPDLDGGRDVMKVAFVSREPLPEIAKTGDEEFDAIMSHFRD